MQWVRFHEIIDTGCYQYWASLGMVAGGKMVMNGQNGCGVEVLVTVRYCNRLSDLQIDLGNGPVALVGCYIDCQ
jgi:hypothetical protein